MSLQQTKAETLNKETRKAWDDPTYWQGVRVGQCHSCKRQKQVTRFGLCWICEGETCPNCERKLRDCHGNCIFN